MTPEVRFRSYVERDDEIAIAPLFELFDELAPIDAQLMLGDWEGGVIRTGHEGERQLGALGWIGKSFHDLDHVDPIITRSGDGERQVNNMLGGATLRMVGYRGVVTATMVYDKHPIFDYFKKVTDDLVLGVMIRKDDPAPLFFYLRRR